MSTPYRIHRGTALIAFTLLGSYCVDAFAYLDPGTGSILIQGAIAGIAAGAFTMKLYWYKLKAFFTGQKNDATRMDGGERSGTNESNTGN